MAQEADRTSGSGEPGDLLSLLQATMLTLTRAAEDDEEWNTLVTLGREFRERYGTGQDASDDQS